VAKKIETNLRLHSRGITTTTTMTTQVKMIGLMPDELSKVIHDFIRPLPRRWKVSVNEDIAGRTEEDTTIKFYDNEKEAQDDYDDYLDRANNEEWEMASVNMEEQSFNPKTGKWGWGSWGAGVKGAVRHTNETAMCEQCYSFCMNSSTNKWRVGGSCDYQTDSCSDCGKECCLGCLYWVGENQFCQNCEEQAEMDLTDEEDE